MGKRLEFVSYSIHARDRRAFIDTLKVKYPTVSDDNLERIAEQELWKIKPRLPHTEAFLIGADVLTDDITTIEAWKDLGPKSRRFFQSHTGQQLFAMRDPQGLSKTYVWNRGNRWIQEVADTDLPILRASKAKSWFRDYDAYGPWPGFARSWEFPVAERFEAPNLEEAARFAADVRKKKMWHGK